MYPAERTSEIPHPEYVEDPGAEFPLRTDADGLPPYGSRLRIARVGLISALAAHVWLVPAPQLGAPLRQLPSVISNTTVHSGLAAVPSVVSRLSADRSRPRVHVRTELVNARESLDGTVGTSGFVRARAESARRPAA